MLVAMLAAVTLSVLGAVLAGTGHYLGTSSPTTPPAIPIDSYPPLADYPNAATTGWRHTGVVLKPSAGMTVTKPGTVLDGLDIAGNLDIKANDVTVQRSRITAGAFYPVRVYPHVTGFRLLDSEVVGVNSATSSCAVGVTGSDLTLERVDIHDCADGFHPGDRSTIRDSYIHDLWLGTDAAGIRVTDTHNDGVQVMSGSHFVIEHNRIEIGHNENAAVFVKSDFGPITDVRIERNYLNGGSYTIFGSDTASAAVTDVSIIGNIFGPSRLFGSLLASKWSGPTVVEGNRTTGGQAVTASGAAPSPTSTAGSR